jgi:hypothetical protein
VVTRLLVALVVLLAVPVAQLRMVDIEASCCCPDPDRCHCPDHEPSNGPASFRACHSSATVLVGGHVAAFTPVIAAPLRAPVRRIIALETHLPAPHARPTAARPAAPS